MSTLFPELDDAYEPPALPATRSSSADVGVVAAVAAPPDTGPRAREAMAVFERLLGFSRDARPKVACELRALAPDGDDRVRVEAGGPEIPAAVFWFARGASDQAFASSPEWSIVHQGAALHPTLAALLRRAATRMTKVPFAVLQDIARVATPPPVISPPASPDGTPDAASTAQEHTSFQMIHSVVFTYGAEDGWFNFFEGHEQYRGYCQRTFGSVVSVHHTELECYFGSAPSDPRAVSFFNTARAELPDGDKRHEERQLFSDMDELDVIKGGTPKLDRMLDSIARSESPPKLIVINAGCTTLVTGDDLEGSADKLRKKVRIPVINAALTPDPRKEILRYARDRGELFADPPQRGSVNIVGLPKMPGHEELLSALEDIGIHVNCRLLPDLDLDSFSRYGAAEFQVLYDWEWNDDAYAMVFEGVSRPSIRPPSPFGVTGTRAWFTAIAKAMGREAELEIVWERRYGAAERALTEARREARGYRLGIIGDAVTLPRMLASERLLGIPLVALLGELGFGVESDGP